MIRLSAEEARQFAAEHFPQAPEKLARLMQVDVQLSPIGTDGYCLQANGHALIRLNSHATCVRRRFTLAHELGHLILGIPTVVGEAIGDLQKQITQEEKAVNQLAGEILLPLKRVKELVHEIPITSAIIKRIAKNAEVSQVVVARRLASVAAELGLKDGLVIFYKDDKCEWQWSDTVSLRSRDAAKLLKECTESAPKAVRWRRQDENDVVVASFVVNPTHNTKTLFLQVINEEDGLKESHEEARRRMEERLFPNDHRFFNSLQGCLSGMKKKVKGLSAEDALRLFNTQYVRDPARWDDDFKSILISKAGQEYILLRLKPWL